MVTFDLDLELHLDLWPSHWHSPWPLTLTLSFDLDWYRVIRGSCSEKMVKGHVKINLWWRFALSECLLVLTSVTMTCDRFFLNRELSLPLITLRWSRSTVTVKAKSQSSRSRWKVTIMQVSSKSVKKFFRYLDNSLKSLFLMFCRPLWPWPWLIFLNSELILSFITLHNLAKFHQNRTRMFKCRPENLWL